MAERDPRAALAELVRDRGESYAALSAWLGRNPAYLQQYVSRGSPRRLAERDRKALAEYLGVAETVLGGPETARAASIRVPRYDVAVSAGPGAIVEDRIVGDVAMDSGLLREVGARAGDLSLVRAAGDSMWPTIAAGDELLVDRGDRKVGKAPAIFVIRLDDAVLVKRLHRAGEHLKIESDNSATAPIGDRSLREVEVIGRVVHLARRLR